MALSGAVNLSEQLKGELLRAVIEVGRKLESVKYHRDNCIKMIDAELAKEKSTWRDHPDVIKADLTTGVEKEVEAFIMQGKSTLDVLSKIFLPLFGTQFHTYGDGEKVINFLKGNLKKKEVSCAQGFVEMIEADKVWINKWFRSERNSIDHYRTLRSTGFREFQRNGESVILPPATIEGVPLRGLVEVLYENLITFCEDFIAMAMSLKFYPGFSIALIPEQEKDPTLPVKFCIVSEPKILPE